MITTFAGDTAEDFRLWAQEIRETRMAAAFRQPRITLCDGNWVTRGDVYDPTGSLVLPLNDVGNISLTLPIDYDDRRGTWAAWWAPSAGMAAVACSAKRKYLAYLQA